MPRCYVMSLMAANRVGVLAALCNALDELGGNLQDVSQTIMRNYFTIILAAEFPDDRPPSVIVDHIRAVCAPFGVEVNLKDPAQDEVPEVVSLPMSTEQYIMTVSGKDRRGSLRVLARRLAHEGIDIVDLDAGRQSDGESFSARLELTIPARTNRLHLQQELETLGQTHGMRIVLQNRQVCLATESPRPLELHDRPAN